MSDIKKTKQKCKAEGEAMTKTVYIKFTVGKSLTEYLTTASVLCYQIDHPLCLHHLKT